MCLVACMTMSNASTNNNMFLEDTTPAPVFERGTSDIVDCVIYVAPLISDVYDAVKAVSARNGAATKAAMERFGRHFEDFQSKCLDKLTS